MHTHAHTHTQLGIWDTAGTERFQSTMEHFYRNVDGVVLVFDVTEWTTFTNIESYWMGILRERFERRLYKKK